jgi:uncharacterized protein
MRGTIEKVEQRVKEILSGESTGHDWYHIDQARTMALRIAEKEGSDKDIVELAALVHEIGDRKFYPDKAEGLAATRNVLEGADVPVDAIEKVMHIAETISFSGGKIPESLEGKIVQDADRMFALGAIGIARAFAFGGKKDRMIYDPEKKDATTIQHFYDKLLLLKEKMNTGTGKKIAQERHVYMEQFLKQFYAEWEGKES